jgi:hypothetical protein
MTAAHLITKGNGGEQLFFKHIELQCRLIDNEGEIAKHCWQLGKLSDEQYQAAVNERIERALAIEQQWKTWTETQP